MISKPTYLDFDNSTYPWRPDIDYRQHPEHYRVGKGEQGVLICEPYKSEIGKHWRFKNVAYATASSKKIYELFLAYLDAQDFVGADMARKYLQMGYTRSRRYFNYKVGKKYDSARNYAPLPRGSGDSEKAQTAEIFYQKWKAAERDPFYAKLKQAWKEALG